MKTKKKGRDYAKIIVQSKNKDDSNYYNLIIIYKDNYKECPKVYIDIITKYLDDLFK